MLGRSHNWKSDEVKSLVEEAEKTMKSEVYENNVNEVKLRKLSEENKTMILKIEDGEVRLEQAEKSLKMANLALGKAEDDLEEERRRAEQEKRDMEEQMQALVEMM